MNHVIVIRRSDKALTIQEHIKTSVDLEYLVVLYQKLLLNFSKLGFVYTVKDSCDYWSFF